MDLDIPAVHIVALVMTTLLVIAARQASQDRTRRGIELRQHKWIRWMRAHPGGTLVFVFTLSAAGNTVIGGAIGSLLAVLAESRHPAGGRVGALIGFCATIPLEARLIWHLRRMRMQRRNGRGGRTSLTPDAQKDARG